MNFGRKVFFIGILVCIIGTMNHKGLFEIFSRGISTIIYFSGLIITLIGGLVMTHKTNIVQETPKVGESSEDKKNRKVYKD